MAQKLTVAEKFAEKLDAMRLEHGCAEMHGYQAAAVLRRTLATLAAKSATAGLRAKLAWAERVAAAENMIRADSAEIETVLAAESLAADYRAAKVAARKASEAAMVAASVNGAAKVEENTAKIEENATAAK